jgi:Tol biopolymer transport system component
MPNRYALALLVLLVIPVLAQSPAPQSVELPELKTRLDLPTDVPLRLVKSDFRLDMPYTIAEFYPENPPKDKPYVTGVLFYSKDHPKITAGEWAAIVADMYKRNFSPEKIEQVSEQKLDRQPGEWLQRVYKVTEMNTPMRHVVIAIRDGRHTYGLLLITPWAQDEKASLQLGDAIVGRLAVAGIAPPGGGTTGGDKPATLPSGPGTGKAVAGVVFSTGKERDLFLQVEGSSKPVNITNSPGFDCDPAFSWDGTQIAFLSGRNSQNRAGGWTDGVYIMNADGSGTPVKITEGDQNDLIGPRFSGDGKKVVYIGGHDFGQGRLPNMVHVVNVDGTGHKLLTGGDDWINAVDWAPDNSKIVFTSWAGKGAGLYTMNPDGSGKTCIVPAGRAGFTGQQPRFAADSKTIILTGQTWMETPRPTWNRTWGAAYLVNVDGTNLRCLHFQDVCLPMILPKGNKFAFLGIHGGDHKIEPNEINVWVRNMNGPHALKITGGNGDLADFDISPVSSDDALPIPKLPCDITFARAANPVGPSFDIYVMTEDAKDLFNVTQTNTYYCEENNPCWSPDKKKIVFDSNAPYWVDGENKGRHDSLRNIYMIDADGSNRVNLTKFRGIETHPVWSPDGTTIAFQRQIEGGYGLFLLDLATGTVRQAADGHVTQRHMTWSNDGATFVVSGTLTGGTLFSTNITAEKPTWTKNRQGASVDPDWNPTRDNVAYFGWNAKGKYALMTFDFPGGPDVDVAELNSGNHPSWAPDGYRIIFDNEQSGEANLFIADVRHSGAKNVVELTRGMGGKNVQPDWSAGPGKTKPPVVAAGPCCIVFTREGSHALWTMLPDGSGMKEVVRGNSSIRDPAVSPDGKTYYFAYVNNASWDIAAIDADGKNFRSLTSTPAQESAPVVSPDGKKIAYNYRADDMKWHHLYVMNADGSGATKRAGADIFADDFPTWSPDSRRLFFSSSDMTNGWLSTMDMYCVAADGSGRQAITNLGKGEGTFGIAYQKAFSPDGKQMAVSICPPDQSETTSLYVGNADGSGLQPVVKHQKGTGVDSLNWGADGRIYFLRSVNNRGNVSYTAVSCNASGGDIKEIVQPDQRPYRMKVSSDAKQMLFVRLPEDRRPAGKVVVVNTDGSNLHVLPGIDNADFAIWATTPK